mgnify:CR=1 FL=1
MESGAEGGELIIIVKPLEKVRQKVFGARKLSGFMESLKLKNSQFYAFAIGRI